MGKFLGVELGSTRIKALLIDESHKPVPYLAEHNNS